MPTVEKIEELILNGPPYLDHRKPFLTLADIGEEVGVSRQTVRNKMPDVVRHPLIRSESVGQAKVYWREYDPEAEDVNQLGEEEFRDFEDEYFRRKKSELVTKRALWLQESQDLLDDTRARTPPKERIDSWEMLVDFLDQLRELGGVSFRGALREKDVPDEYSSKIDLEPFIGDSAPLPDELEHLEPVLYDVPLFTSSVGVDVEGIVMLFVHHYWMGQRVDEDTPEEELDEVVPSRKDIRHAGDIVDRFATQLYGFDW